MKGTKVILGADKSYKNTNVKKVNAQRAATHWQKERVPRLKYPQCLQTRRKNNYLTTYRIVSL